MALGARYLWAAMALLVRAFALHVGQGHCWADEVQAALDVTPLLRELDDDDFGVREAAERKLRGLGPSIWQPLIEAHTSTSPEVRFRIRRVLEYFERERITGDWQLIRWEADGEAKTGTENVIQVRPRQWKSGNSLLTYQVNPLATPKEINWVSGNNLYRGIYKIDGEHLILCVTSKANQPRPKDFKTALGDGFKLHTRVRVAMPTDDAADRLPDAQ